MEAEGEAVPAPGWVLRPLWEEGKRYRWLQRMEAEVTVSGLGTQSMEWRQHFHVTPFAADGERGLEIGVDRIRMDFDVTGDRSRYYFDRSIPLRFQERQGIQGLLLRHTEQLVRNRYRLLSLAENRHRLVILAAVEREDVARQREPASPEWEGFPWEALTSALLHQGIPEEPVEKGAEWKHAERLEIPTHGAVTWDYASTFSGFKEYEERELALVKMNGSMRGELYENTAVEGSPGVGLAIPKVRGLTLIDFQQRRIVSTVVKLEGRLKSLGLPGAAEDETAPLRKTLSLTLLGVDEEMP
jgi:hypothetical protein